MKTIFELEDGMCRYALNGDSDRMTVDTPFCGKPTRQGSSWCPHHARVVFTDKPAPRRKKPAPEKREKTFDDLLAMGAV